MSHKPLRVSLELQEIFESPNDEPFLGEPAEDWISKFESSAAINATFCDGRDHSAQLAAELAPVDARCSAIYRKLALDAAKPSDLERSLQKLEPTRSDALAKADSTPAGLRREALRQFIVKSLSNGESVGDLCSYAAVRDPQTAAEMRSIAAEMMR